MPIAQYILDAVDAAGDLSRIPSALPAISMPPCTTCQHFVPQASTDAGGNYVSVLLCDAPHEQARDFSCYEPRT